MYSDQSAEPVVVSVRFVEPESADTQNDFDFLTTNPGSSTMTDARPTFVQYISQGVLNIEVVEEDELDRDIFSQEIVSMRVTLTANDETQTYNTGFSSLQNGESDVINTNFNSLARSIVAYSSIEAERFYFDDVFYINEDISTVGVSIATSNISRDTKFCAAGIGRADCCSTAMIC